MCGRYYVTTDEELEGINEIIREVNEKHKNNNELSLMKTGEIFPSDIVPVVTPWSPQLMKWGFTFDGKGQVINARSETINEKPMFQKPFCEGRCLIPASYYFEWEKRGTQKVKYAIGLNKPIYMAGLYRIEKDSNLPRFVILTRPAAEGVVFIHDRMPLIIPEDMQKDWLSKDIDIKNVIEQSVEDLAYKIA